jgi:hypothetical protein
MQGRFYLDKSFNSATWEDWRHKQSLCTNLSDEVIDNAFDQILPDTIDEDTDKIKEILKQRREIGNYRTRPLWVFQKYEIIIANSKDTIDAVFR